MDVNPSTPVQPQRFPRPGTTYQPAGFSAAALRSYGRGDYELLLSELQAKPRDGYERAGVDRALAIAVDLALSGMRGGATILDVGCSTGTISRLLSETGYRVTGVDPDVVANVQEWQSRELLLESRRRVETATCRLVTSDILEFLEQTNGVFDVALLLSVLHHFLQGYGYSGVQKLAADRFDAMLKLLCSRIRSYLYVEVPGPDELLEMPPDPAGRFIFPSYFLEAGLASSLHMIAATVATNGKLRRLYRIQLR